MQTALARGRTRSRSPRRLLAFGVTALTFALVACGGDDSSSGGGASTGTCASAGTKICERACACGQNGECKTGVQGSAGVTTFTWSDLADCKGGYVGLACQGSGPPGVDFAACESAVTAASCDKDVFVVPKACDSPKDGG